MAIKHLADYKLRIAEQTTFGTAPTNPVMLPVEIEPGTSINPEYDEILGEGHRGDAQYREHFLVGTGWSGSIRSELFPDHSRLFQLMLGAMRGDENAYIGLSTDQLINTSDIASAYFYAYLDGTSTEKDWSDLGLAPGRWLNVASGHNAAGSWQVDDIIDAPVKLGHLAGAANMLDSANSVAVSPDGNYVYVAAFNSSSMVIIDVTNKAAPVKLGHLAGAGNMLVGARSVAVSPDGNYVYVAAFYSSSMVIIDVTDKNAPFKLGHLDGALNMLDGAASVSVSPDGYYVYVASVNSSSMVIIDVTNKAAPVKLGHLDGALNMLDGARSVSVSPDGNYVYVASVNSSSMVIIDVTNKAAPVKLGHLDGAGNMLVGAYSVAVSPDGNYVYVAAFTSSAMVIIDVTNKAAPAKLGHLAGAANMLSGAVGIAVSSDGNYVHVAASSSNAMVIIDVTNKAAPAKLGHVAGAANMLSGAGYVSVSPDGNYVYVVANTSDSMAAIHANLNQSLAKLSTGGISVTETTIAADATINYLYVSEAKTDHLFTIEEDYGDSDYIAYRDARVDGFNIEFAAQDICHITFDLVGGGVDTDGVTLGTGSRSDTYRTGETYYFNEYSLKTKEGGTDLSDCIVSGNIDVRHNYRRLRGACAGTSSKDIIHGKLAVTGSFVVRNEDFALFEKAINDDESSLEFVFNNKDNKPLVIYIPLLKYNTAELSAHDGADSDSLITVTF
ncbi:MAG: phage tail tube protein, partial [Eubacteriales bacterium]|nr:phage tail tube protein [Eubacteriales bacterium]